MSDETPAETLRRASARVRELGEAAHARGPYSVEGRCLCFDDEDFEDRCDHRESSWRVRTEVPDDPTIISYEVAPLGDEGDARWLALMSPALAEPLAAWLELAASSADHIANHRNGAPGEAARTAAALNVARALLGEDPS